MPRNTGSCRDPILPLCVPSSPEPSGRGRNPRLRDHPPSSRPRPQRGPAGPAVRGQGRGSGNPLTALGHRARAKDRSKQRSHGAGGPATGVLSHPAAAAAAGWSPAGNRKMCTSYVWNRRRDLQRKGVGRGRPSPSPEGGLSNWLGHSRSLHAPPNTPMVLSAPGWNSNMDTHTTSFLLFAGTHSCPQMPPSPPLAPGQDTTSPSPVADRHDLGPPGPRAPAPTASSGRKPGPLQVLEPTIRTQRFPPRGGGGRSPLIHAPLEPRALREGLPPLPSAHRLRPAQRAHSNPPRPVWSPILSRLIPVGLGAPPGRTDLRTL
nr:extensin-like [Macaca nemestrina]